MDFALLGNETYAYSCCVTARNMNLEGKIVWLWVIFMLLCLSLLRSIELMSGITMHNSGSH
jgi:hypothetical protein